MSWPGLNMKTAHTHFPESEETQKGQICACDKKTSLETMNMANKFTQKQGIRRNMEFFSLVSKTSNMSLQELSIMKRREIYHLGQVRVINS